MVSSKLSIRKYSSTIPSWCIVPPAAIIPPPPLPPWDTSKPLFLTVHWHYTINSSLVDIVDQIELPPYGYQSWYKWYDRPLWTIQGYILYNDWDGIFTCYIFVVWKSGAALSETAYAGPYFLPNGFLLELYGWNPNYGFFEYYAQLSSATIP